MNEQIQLLWRTVADGVYLLRREGAFVDVNPIGCTLLDYTRDELLGLNVLDVQEGLDASAWDDLWETMAPGATLSMETSVRRRDGTHVPVQARITPVESGTDVVMLALVRDVSSAHRGTDADVVGAAMTREREEQVRSQADRLRQLEAVAGTTAHDLKNLLGVILNYGAFAVEAAADRPELHADLMEMVQAAERATAIAVSLEQHAIALAGAHRTAIVEKPLGSESLLRSVGAALERRS